MGRDGDEEEVGAVRVFGAEAALADVLEEVSLAGVLARELPRRLIEGLGVAVRVDVDLEEGGRGEEEERPRQGRR